METKFTPGPWRVDPEHNCDVQALGDVVLEIASTAPILLTGGSHPEGATPQDNARLIAAAPELYEALTKAAETFRVYERLHRAKEAGEGNAKADANAATAAMCEAALAKARGEQ